MITKSKLRRWGNSYLVIVPKRLVEEEGLREGEEVEISLNKLVDIKSLRGRFPVENLQEAKEETRKGWRH